MLKHKQSAADIQIIRFADIPSSGKGRLVIKVVMKTLVVGVVTYQLNNSQTFAFGKSNSGNYYTKKIVPPIVGISFAMPDIVKVMRRTNQNRKLMSEELVN